MLPGGSSDLSHSDAKIYQEDLFSILLVRQRPENRSRAVHI